MDRAFLHRPIQRALIRVSDEDTAHLVPELLHIAGRFCDAAAGAAFHHALWYGPALRQAIEAAIAPSSSGSGSGSSSSQSTVISVKLDSCAIVRVVTYQEFDEAEYSFAPHLSSRLLSMACAGRSVSTHRAAQGRAAAAYAALAGPRERDQEGKSGATTSASIAQRSAGEEEAAAWVETRMECSQYVRRLMAVHRHRIRRHCRHLERAVEAGLPSL